MCGIVGWAASSPVGVGDATERLAAACDILRHRGPDDSGVWTSTDGRVALGHRRLAIVDLSATGHQPMTDAGGWLRIVFNGEIYNFRELREELHGRGHAFRGTSDTEVLLAAYREWGPACVSRLDGMFAFVIYDPTARRLFAARDRAGEKPFFFAHIGGRFAFASEVKALLASDVVSRTLDLESLELYLERGYVPWDRCIVRGVQKLPPAHALTYELETDRLTRWRYWELPAPCRGIDVSADALTDRLEALLTNAVRQQLVADVPVGVLLSGGLDSSLITALAARSTAAPVHTFTISLPGHGALDEAAHARLVAAHFGTRHTELVAEPASAELLPALARQYDEPLADSSLVPTYMVSRLVRQHATVALGGDGGDELFGGYRSYNAILRRARVQRLVPATLRRAMTAAAYAVPPGVRGRNLLIRYSADLTDMRSGMAPYFDAPTRARLLAPLGARRYVGAAPSPLAGTTLGAVALTPLQRATTTDFLSYLPDDILVKVDRASMLASLEVRAPFLDHHVIEFAFGSVPDRWRATATSRKVLLRRLAGRLLPPAFDLTRKQGFSIPVADWLRGAWRPMAEDVLGAADPSLFDRRVVRELLDGQRRGRSTAHLVFSLTMFELWRRAYGATL